MPDKPEDRDERRRNGPADHIASKHDAFRSEFVQSLAKNMLVVGASDAPTQHMISLLRAMLGRKVETRAIVGIQAAIRSLGDVLPSAILLRDTGRDGGGDQLASVMLTQLRAAGFPGIVIVVCDQLTARDAIDLRREGAADVIEIDDLDSVRLYEALLKAAKPLPDQLGKLAWLQ